MKLFALVLLGFALVSAKASSADLLLGAMGRSEVTQEAAQLTDAIKLQSTQVAEASLKVQSASSVFGGSGCFHRSVCAVATEDFAGRSEDIPRHSMASGLLHFRSVLEEMVGALGEGRTEEFPNIHKALASFRVGSSTRSLDLCEQLFACERRSAEELRDEAMSVSTTHDRTTCAAAGTLCPGISIGCALCGVFAPGTCGDQCIVAGLYCGVSAYACTAAGGEATTTTTTSAPAEPVSKRAPALRRNGVGIKPEEMKRREEIMKFLFGDLAY